MIEASLVQPEGDLIRSGYGRKVRSSKKLWLSYPLHLSFFFSLFTKYFFSLELIPHYMCKSEEKII